MKKQVGKAWKRFFGVVMALMMVIGVIAPTAATVRAAGTEVTYLGGHLGDQKVQEGESIYQAFCANKGRPMGTAGLASTRIKYAWDEAPTEYQAIGANSLFGDLSGFSYALSLVILPGLYDGDSPRSDTQNSFMPNDENDIKTCAQYLKNVFYYAELDGHSANEIQDAIYDIIYQGKNNPNTSALGTLAQKAINGSDNGKTELWVYLPHPNEYAQGNGYNRGGVDQALVRGVPHVSPEVAVYLHGIKELKGGQLKDEQFSFTISGPNIEETTKVNYGSDIWFPEIKFDAAGDYTYTIKEVKGNDSTITYDEKEKTFTVNVTQDTSGKLIASVDGTQVATSDDKKEDGSLKAGEINGSVDKYKFVNEVKSDDSKKPTVKTKVNPNEVEAAANQTFTDTVTLTNLTEGVEYTITGQLMDKEAQEKVEATCEPVTFTASAEDAAAASVEIEMKFTFDGTNFAGKELVVFETLSWKDCEKPVEHHDYDDADQTITVKEPKEPTPPAPPADRNPKIATTVTAGDKKATASQFARLTYDEIAGEVTVVDAIDYEGLIAGTTYTVSGTLVEVDLDGNILNEEVATASEDLVAESASGTWNLDFGKVQLEPYKKYVVFESVYAAGGEDEKATEEKPLEHKDVNDKAQTIMTEDEEGQVLGESEEPTYSGKLATTVSAGGKTATADKEVTLTAAEAEKVTKVTDTIKYSGLQGGDTYLVTGLLMKVKGTEVTQVGNAVSKELKADDSGEGTWTMEFDKVKLEADTKYVVFESALNMDTTKADDQAVHADIKDKAQTIVVEAKKSAVAPSKSVASPKTGDTNQPLLWIGLLAAAACAGVVLVRKRRA